MLMKTRTPFLAGLILIAVGSASMCGRRVEAYPVSFSDTVTTLLAQSDRTGWGLILGADDTREKALHEVSKALSSLGVHARIYKCGSWFRTVAVFDDKKKALSFLSKAQAGSPYNPYIVDLSLWCPAKERVK